MKPLTLEEAQQVAKDLLGQYGFIWYDDQWGTRWVLGTRKPHTYKFLFWNIKSERIFIHGVGVTMEGAILNTEYTLNRRRQKALDAWKTRIEVAQKARSSGFRRNDEE